MHGILICVFSCLNIDRGAFWRERLDTDGDGVLGLNELRTLAALLSDDVELAGQNACIPYALMLCS